MSDLHKRMHQQLLDMLGATDHEDAAGIIAGFHGAKLATLEKGEEATYRAWFFAEQGKPYDGMWQFARAAWMARAGVEATRLSQGAQGEAVAPAQLADYIIGNFELIGRSIDERMRDDLIAVLGAAKKLYTHPPERAAVPDGWKITRTDDVIFPVRIAGPEGHVWHPEGGSPAARLALALLTAATQPPEGARVVDDDGLYYLQDSRSYVGNCPQWWAKDRAGYTSRLDEAHRFTFDEAMQQHRERDTDIPWPCAEIDALARRTVDHQHMRSIREQRAKLSDAPTLDGKEVT